MQDMEVIVVDNQSTDGSLEYLQPKFPFVRFIEPGANLGFAKACNTGLTYANGNYILFLNPDTIIAEDTVEKCIRFFHEHKDAGAIGVRMLDGSGKFLKESKRAFPSPLISLFKLFGLTAVFPKSKTFSRYYLGHLDEMQNHKVDVLAGAFMMVPKDVLDKVGSFDEAFFMYGEDIDLSYRIQKEGYRNYYLAETEIIHFKGESTKRGSLNYVLMFYQAMSIFVHKHYGGVSAGVFNGAIHFAIWVRALISAFVKLIWRVGPPLADAILIMLSFWLIKEGWANWVKGGHHYPGLLLQIAFPAFTFIYLVTAYYAGLYDKVFRIENLQRSTLIATLVLLAGYALLPEQYRFSRGIILFGSLLSFILIYGLRFLLLKGGILLYPPQIISKPYILVASSEDEYKEIELMLQQQQLDTKVIDRFEINSNISTRITLGHIDAIATASGAREMIICAGKLSLKHIIHLMQHIHISIWLHIAGSSSIVGSNSSYTSGDVLTTEENFNLSLPHNRRIKRLIDVLTALSFLFTFPLHCLMIKHPFIFLRNCFQVLLGTKTWIGYQTAVNGLPPLPPAVVSESKRANAANENVTQLDYWYARNYEPVQDVKLIFRNYKYLNV